MSMGERISADKLIDGRTRRRLERSNDVYLAAVGLFIDQGYDATTMDDIADRADVSRASVFNYFPRKVQFLEEWASRRRHQAVDAVRLKHLEDDPIGDILARYFDELARVSTATRVETVSLMGAAVTSGDLLSDPPLGHELAIYIARARDRGELTPEVDPDQVGLLLATGYFATICRWIARDPAPVDLQDELHGVLAIVLGGILRH
jgi:AcrR family transcriptional regulator